MAVDKKSQHVGNHGGTYTDLDGMSKQFTYVDHDKKSTISLNTNNQLENWQVEYRSCLIKRIANISASLCPEIFSDFTLRGKDRATIEWNMDMLIDQGIPLDQLRSICVILENRQESHIKLK